MKEIKAYVRNRFLRPTVKALNERGAPGITIVTVHPGRRAWEADYFIFAQAQSKNTMMYFDMTKIELVCEDQELDSFISTIKNCAYSDSKSEPLIFVSEVGQAKKSNGLGGERQSTILACQCTKINGQQMTSHGPIDT